MKNDIRVIIPRRKIKYMDKVESYHTRRPRSIEDDELIGLQDTTRILQFVEVRTHLQETISEPIAVEGVVIE